MSAAQAKLQGRGHPRYDVAIIGAGMSGLAAGIRLAMFDKKVALIERHTVWGGLNSFYKKGGHHFDTGLHALTNWVDPSYRGPRIPLARVARQLRLRLDALELAPQRFSAIAFPSATLSFSNGLSMLEASISEVFPGEIDGFRRLAAAIVEYPDALAVRPFSSARRVLSEYLREPLLIDMLLAPLLYYGSAVEHDLDFDQFIILFNSIYREGFCRPRGGVKPLIRALVARLEESGGLILRGDGVQRIEVEGRRVARLVLDSGATIEADRVISSAGRVETARLRSDGHREEEHLGELAFFEAIHVLDRPVDALGHEATIVFYSARDELRWARSAELVDLDSGVICCPGNYLQESDAHHLRVTHLASWSKWAALSGEAYAAAKQRWIAASNEVVRRHVGDFGPHLRYTDSFTPNTVTRFTSHPRGLIYGSPDKVRSGRTDLENLYLCGTDQGLLGIVGAMSSGIAIANAYGLEAA